ncbi:hypothetical protein SAMN04488559_11362 [Isobaculum melis]|uniref:Baseplate upper protein immunoglobulin like domain-containing protein n=1 Tax=Isobaculum melis TaxID=142588 RepID=A0A1H9TII2_9LACT|nr:hypothetical protein SAMN04488559_11362 [Isobaculum melis]
MFFPSKNGDRKYKASDFTGYFSQLFSNGVFSNNSENLQVLASKTNGLSIVVEPGYGNINGYLYASDQPKTLLFDISDVAGTAKKAAVVLRLDLNEREMSVHAKNTDELTRTKAIYELMLARIHLPGDGAAITQSMIQDTRGDGTLCGYVHSLIDIDPTTLWLQFEADWHEWYANKQHETNINTETLKKYLVEAKKEFQTWFENLQDMLDENTASNLQNQLNQLNADQHEMKATEALLTVEHNLNEFPQVSALAWQYGIGTVPLSTQPSNISFDGTDVFSIAVEARHYNRHKLTVLVPKNYCMENPTIVRTAPNKYLLVEGIYSVEITIGNHQNDVKQYVETTMKLDLKGRKIGSLKENPHSYLYDVGAQLISPTAFRYGLINGDKTLWNAYESLEGINQNVVHTTSQSKGNMTQQLAKFNVIEALSRKFTVMKNMTLSQKLIFAQKSIYEMTVNAYALGKGVGGNKVTIKTARGTRWDGIAANNLNEIKRIGYTATGENATYYLNSDGFYYALLHAEASDGALVKSELKVDYINLELKLRSEM